jgi:hypothetical protein
MQSQEKRRLVAAASFWTVAGWMQGRPAPSDVSAKDLADLAAQQSMADAAWAMFGVSLISTAVAAAGIYFLFRSLEAARTGTAEAIEAVQVSRDIGQRQLRAYMLAEDFEIEIGSVDQLDAKRPPLFSFRLQNYGQTPAKFVTFFAQCTPERPSILPSVRREEGHSLRDFGPGAADRQTVTAQWLVEDAHMAFYYGEEPVWLHGVIEYEDIFGKKHRSWFRRQFTAVHAGSEIHIARVTPEDGNLSD